MKEFCLFIDRIVKKATPVVPMKSGDKPLCWIALKHHYVAGLRRNDGTCDMHGVMPDLIRHPEAEDHYGFGFFRNDIPGCIRDSQNKWQREAPPHFDIWILIFDIHLR